MKVTTHAFIHEYHYIEEIHSQLMNIITVIMECGAYLLENSTSTCCAQFGGENFAVLTDSLPKFQPESTLPMYRALAARSSRLVGYSSRFFTQKRPFSEEMSYRSGGAGGYRGRSGRGGPNRGGGGRGRGRGRGRGGGGGPPPGLSGREIGLFYAARSKAKKKEKDRNEVFLLSFEVFLVLRYVFEFLTACSGEYQ